MGATMVNEKEFVEQRKQKRFKVKDRAFAVLGPDALKLCHMIDISKGGLSFRYFIDSEELAEEIFELGVLFGDDFYLEKIPARVISDNVIENDSHFSTVIMRRRGVQFGDLSSRQKEQIDYFIKHNTTAEL